MLGELVSDYEIVIVDNASDDDSLLHFKALTGQVLTSAGGGGGSSQLAGLCAY